MQLDFAGIERLNLSSVVGRKYRTNVRQDRDSPRAIGRGTFEIRLRATSPSQHGNFGAINRSVALG